MISSGSRDLLRPHLAAFGAVILATAACGTGRSEDVPAAHIATIPRRGEWVAPIGTELYRTFGSDAYRVDLSDPRRPVLDEDSFAYGGVACGLGCAGFRVQRGPTGSLTGYFLGTTKLGAASLPDSEFPKWLLELPEPDRFVTFAGLEQLPDGTLVVSRQERDSGTGGDLLFIDVSSGMPFLSERVLTDFPAHFVAADGFTVLTMGTGATAVVYDATDPTLPVEVARLKLPEFPDDFIPFRYDLNASDLIVTSYDGNLERHGVFWYRFAPDWSSVVRAGADETFPVYATYPPVVYGRFAFVNQRGSEGEPRISLSMFVLDSSEGLVEIERIGLDAWDPGSIALDVERQLLFVGGTRITVLDLRLLTTDLPRQQ